VRGLQLRGCGTQRTTRHISFLSPINLEKNKKKYMLVWALYYKQLAMEKELHWRIFSNVLASYA
jgi:hypothetical protein